MNFGVIHKKWWVNRVNEKICRSRKSQGHRGHKKFKCELSQGLVMINLYVKFNVLKVADRRTDGLKRYRHYKTVFEKFPPKHPNFRILSYCSLVKHDALMHSESLRSICKSLWSYIRMTIRLIINRSLHKKATSGKWNWHHSFRSPGAALSRCYYIDRHWYRMGSCHAFFVKFYKKSPTGIMAGKSLLGIYIYILGLYNLFILVLNFSRGSRSQQKRNTWRWLRYWAQIIDI